MNWSLVLVVLVVCGISPSFGDGQSSVFWSPNNLAYSGTEQFAEAKSGLMCYATKAASECGTLVNQADPCANYANIITCMKEKAKACDVETNKVISNTMQNLEDMCKEGTELNNGYLKHKTCIFGSGSEALGPCAQDLVNEIQKKGKTDQDTIFKLTCKFADSINVCAEKKMDETCGKEAGAFFRKYKGPGSELDKAVCNGATSFNFISTFLLQVSAVFFALKFSKNYV